MNINHLCVDGIWHKYRSIDSGKWTLQSICLDIKPGELVGLVGPSGCGKTTLLRLIAGFEKPTSGKISFQGIEVTTPTRILPPERRGIGMVFQDYALFPHLNVWKNVCFGIAKSSNTSRANWLLDLLGISELKFRYPHELSGGQRQRVALARALAPGTSLILLDEPFCSLDQEVRIRLRNELSSVLKSCETAALFVTHDSQEALAICNRIAVMEQGFIHQFSTPQELVSRPLTPFVGRFVLQRNSLPIHLKNNEYFTPIGKIPLSDSIKLKDVDTIMFDSKAISISLSSSGNAIVKSSEFCYNHWIVTIMISNYKLRVWYEKEAKLGIGDKCEVSFIPNQSILLFPGSIKTYTA